MRIYSVKYNQMKKIKKVIFMLSLLLAVPALSSLTWAGGEINNSNLSAKYLRDLNPYTEADPIYNPAGLAFENKNSITIGLQTIFQKYYSGFPYTNVGVGVAENTNYIPDISFHYRYNDSLSFIGAYYISAGVGEVSYDMPTTIHTMFIYDAGKYYDEYLIPFESYYITNDLCHTLKGGFVYKKSENLGLSGGFITVYGKKKMNLTFPPSGYGAGTSLFELKSKGLGWFVSLHYQYKKLFDFSVNFTSPVYLNWKYDTIDINPTMDEPDFFAEKNIREDIPASFNIGAKRNIVIDSGKIELKLGVTCFLQNDDSILWEDILYNTNSYWAYKGHGYIYYVVDKRNTFENAWEISAGVTWEPKKSNWKFYAGYMYGYPGVDMEKTSKVKPSLISHNIGIGFDYKISNNSVLNFGFACSYYDSKIVGVGISRKMGRAGGYYDLHGIMSNGYAETFLGAKKYNIGIGYQYYF